MNAIKGRSVFIARLKQPKLKKHDTNHLMLVKEIKEANYNGWSRVETIIDGEPLWFESQDVHLSVSAEAFASALLIPALTRNQKLTLEMPLSRQWLDGARKIAAIFNEWWNYPVIFPEGTGGYIDAGYKKNSTGQCFSCGVDSFYTLMQNSDKVSHLVYIFGFDMPLRLKNRMAVLHSALKEIALNYGKKLIVIRTNFKEHPIFADVNWVHAHGAILAAAGHLLREEIGRLIVPSTYIDEEDKAWGSSYEIDHLWSSECMQIVHFEEKLMRIHKIRAIVNMPLVKKHLRVCWEMRKPLINCSECEKCIRNMLCLSRWGLLEQFETFNHSVPLVKLIDSLPFIPPHLQVDYRNFLEEHFGDEIKAAIKKLLERSPAEGHKD